ncbi:hypothetical protein BDV96DRAFT_597398 [Lophiotrema nucula]|uniref:Metallo-beta-lactamase domain-containing protein n=1 Tax=Lophiotrema nucula TaxID=690887 RepID=A0A6A5ZHP3_9PLEO|nr:hypothetical protein BDV96DRAFT_597398 [Lophiotrema nucula]
MKALDIFAYPAATACLILATCAHAESRPFDSILKRFHMLSSESQSPLAPIDAIMPGADEQVSTGVIISDVIGKTQTIAIFSGLTRDIDSVSNRLDDASQNATVLAPENTVMRNLKRKPWEDPEDYSAFGKGAYEGAAGEDRAHRNLRRFVESHIVPASPWKEGEKVKTLSGSEVWWESNDGKKKIQPSDVEVVSIADKVSNGESTTAPRKPTIAMAELKLESEDLLICVTCGTQFDVPYDQGLKSCRLCDDPRQYVPLGGQKWTSLAREKGKFENKFQQDEHDERIWFITTEAKASPGPKTAAASLKPDASRLGIGERGILLQTPHGNILWDLIAWLDQGTIDFINSKGGLKGIVISHPHFYTTHLEWAKQFNCPVYTSKADEEWLNRKDSDGLRMLIEGTTEIILGVTAIQCGGHFDGSLVLHWDKKLFLADTFMSVPSGIYHKDRPPGTTSYSFMWSYPNMIPLPPSKVHGIWKAIKPFEFTATYGGFPGQNIVREHLKSVVLESMKIFVQGAGHENAEILEESL